MKHLQRPAIKEGNPIHIANSKYSSIRVYGEKSTFKQNYQQRDAHLPFADHYTMNSCYLIEPSGDHKRACRESVKYKYLYM